MKFRTIPPEAGELSCVKLLWPPAVPAAIWLFAWLADLNVHSGEGVAAFMLLLVTLLVGTIASIVNLTSVLPALRRHPSLRSCKNLLCAGISLAFVVGVTSLFIGVLASGLL